MGHLFIKLMLFSTFSLLFAGCGGSDSNTDNAATDDNTSTQDDTETTVSTFAKGADVSWLTEMEASGYKFYDADGTETECMTLLKSMGVNAIRLRVWVDPDDGWCGKDDVVAKAVRAYELGMRIMIDFHYSDTWADPSKQTIPAAWTDYSLSEMKQAVADHTEDVLQALSDNGVDVEWVQVGNETRTGMLWDVGLVSNDDFTNFAQLVNAGYSAVKNVYADAKVIVHIDNGYDLSLFTWMFDGLQDAGAKWDVIGMSIYPEESTWSTRISSCLSNMTTLINRYNCEIMLCEIGMSWDADFAEDAMTKMVNGCKDIDDCLGVFYWEPECYGSWKGYTKGAFDNTGKPTSTLDVFSED